MRSRTAAVLVLSSALAGGSTFAYAQNDPETESTAGGAYVGLMGSYSVLRDTDGSVGGTPIVAEHDDGFGVGLTGGYDLDAARVELELQYLSNQYADDSAAAIGSDDLRSIGAFVNGWYHPFRDWRVTPYVGAGFGYLRRDVAGENNWGTAIQLGIGADYPLKDQWVLTGLVRVFDSEEIEFEQEGQAVGLPYEGLLASLGVRYEFAGPPPPPPPPPPEPVEVTEPLPACGDGLDNDEDGLIDHPDDPGCADAEDDNEADPCKTPELGERVDLRGCGTGDRITLKGVNFELNKATLTADSSAVLDDVAEQLVANPHIRIEVGGHTDSTGSQSYNQNLSERRANSVRNYLVNAGVEGERLTAVGYGEDDPVASNDSVEGRAENRRVELKIL